MMNRMTECAFRRKSREHDSVDSSFLHNDKSKVNDDDTDSGTYNLAGDAGVSLALIFERLKVPSNSIKFVVHQVILKMASATDLLELARHLKQEQLFVSSERDDLQVLNLEVLKLTEQIYHVSWISRQQRIILEHIILGHSDFSPSQCCLKANALELVSFCDSYKHLGFHDSLYGEFLQKLRENPRLLALCLISGEKLGLNINSQVNVFLLSIYGNCILYEDELLVLKLLEHLIELQLATSNNPGRMLRHGSCALSRVYKIFSEGLFSAKLYLTAALHAPILHLLMEDDMFLDIDPEKSVIRYPPDERLRRFGEVGSLQYAINFKKHREWIIEKLVNLTNRFINSIKQNMYCFPQSLSWLIRQVYQTVMKVGKVDIREVGAMCANLLVTFFICPAIVNPEPYSITTDTPISYVARFNLMQVAQILQILVMSKWEAFDPKHMDLFGKFDKNCMSSVLDLILEGNEYEIPKTNPHNPLGLKCSAVLITESDLMDSATVQANNNDDHPEFKYLETCLASLPVKAVDDAKKSAVVSSSTFSTSNTNIKKNTLTRIKNKHRPSVLMQRDHSGNTSDIKHENSDAAEEQLEKVLVVTINFDHGDCPGMLSAEKVLIDYNKQTHVKMNAESIHNCYHHENVSASENMEKRTRFSLTHDQDSIGNTSDNLEAVSEAASNHSGESSIEMENENEENDNYSDMVSANVSGRGTPNVSGRDTPSSQIEEESESQSLNLPVTAKKQNREDIDDKFGKFEIKPISGGDETISMVSDTWSTDVLASDSENVEQPDISSARPDAYMLDSTPGNSSFLDISETASDAWSTDVLPSDTDRQDVDTDDTGSVTTAKSDDTARSEVDVDVFAAPSSYGHAAEIDEDIDQANYQLIKTMKDAANKANPSCSQLLNEFSATTLEYSGENINSTMFARLSQPNMNRSGINYGRREEPEGMEDKISNEANIPDQRRKHPSNSSRTSSASNDIPSSPKFQILSVDCYESRKEQIRDNTNRIAVSSSQFNAEESSVLTMAVKITTEEKFTSQDKRSISRESNLNNKPTKDLNASIAQNISQLCDNVEMHIDESNVKAGHNHGTNVSEIFDQAVDNDDLSTSTHKLRQELADIRLSTTSSGSSTSVGEGSKSSSSLNGNNIYMSENASVTLDVDANGKISKSNFDEQAENMMDDQNSGDGADKGSRDKDKKGFFKSLKFPFKSRAKKFKGSERGSSVGNSPDVTNRQPIENDQGYFGAYQQSETGEDILAKYRKKSIQDENIPADDNIDSHNMDCVDGNQFNSVAQFNPSDPGASFVFYDAKRKLRMVLGTADIPMLPSLSRSFSQMMQKSTSSIVEQNFDNELVAFLNILLAEATNLEQRSLIAQLHEALRCVRLFDYSGCKKLLKSLKEDYKKRSPYIAYLIKSRQGLLGTRAHLRRTLDRIQRDKEVCNKSMIAMCVKLFLSQREDMIIKFTDNFQQLTVPDEKTDFVEKFLESLYEELRSDALWKGASELQIEMATQVIERDIMGQIYLHSMYPNNDGDVSRDQVLHDHIKKLAAVITPSHKDLCIPMKYLYECPWPSAQAEIITINAYKTPKDKLQCVLRCCSTIMNLLSMVSERTVPAADDFMPVLVYVLIKANPPSLLSTVQYVNSFYENRLGGEESYWWTQFASAIEFIKTLD
ncbi:GTPase-activating protein and VPS9 domain-containing protein 1 [Nymphon striatum]|nr:GTPase-activating protein and VPS9 domain-containing protein 1 [Nymphon striatum]